MTMWKKADGNPMSAEEIRRHTANHIFGLGKAMRLLMDGLKQNVGPDVLSEEQLTSPNYSSRRRAGVFFACCERKWRFMVGAGTGPPFPHVGRRPGVVKIEFAGGSTGIASGG